MTSQWSRRGRANRRPRVLFVTYGFPPARRAGCVRTGNIAKFLAQRGWAVTVLTLDPALHRYVDDSETTTRHLEREGIERLSTGHRWRWLATDSLNCPNTGISWLIGGVCRRTAKRLGIDPSVGWVREAERACKSLTPTDIDIVLASGPPFSAFPLARRLANRLECPYVLDYRDLWSRHLYNPVPTAFQKEALVLAGSAAVTIVSPSWGRVLDKHFMVGHKVHTVSNGYDPEDLLAIQAHEFGHFAIVYTGTFWPPKRVVSPVMAALRRLTQIAPAYDSWKFHYYGSHGHHVLQEAERFGVTDRVIDHGLVSRVAARAAVKGAGVSLVITSVEEGTLEDDGMVTGKIFEAIGLRTPILLIAPISSDAKSVVENTGLGRSFTAGDVGGIASFLLALMGGDRCEPQSAETYTWDKLVDVLGGVLGNAIRSYEKT
jgi:glycosyltransferase involved in cell wall biosynthesis